MLDGLCMSLYKHQVEFERWLDMRLLAKTLVTDLLLESGVISAIPYCVTEIEENVSRPLSFRFVSTYRK